VVVYLEGVPGAKTFTANRIHEIVQRDRKFVPAVSAVLKGTTIAFPNEDHIVHNVFSTSEAARFDLGAYKHGTTRSIVAHDAGVIRIYCNMHDEMEAAVLVLETNYHCLTSRDGTFEIPNVPPGTYAWHAWQPNGRPASGTVKVDAFGAEPIETELLEVWPPRHRRKDGSLYDEY